MEIVTANETRNYKLMQTTINPHSAFIRSHGNTVKGNVVYVMGTGGIKLSAQILLV